jgi:hypothetical protein
LTGISQAFHYDSIPETARISLDHPGKHPLGHPQGLPESLCFFGLYGSYLAVVLLPARLRRNDGAQQEDVELEDRGLISERWGKDWDKIGKRWAFWGSVCWVFGFA